MGKLETLVVYTAESCPHCRALIADFTLRKVRYVKKDVSRDAQALEQLRLLSWERKLPTVVDHERISIGFQGQYSTFDDLGL